MCCNLVSLFFNKPTKRGANLQPPSGSLSLYEINGLNFLQCSACMDPLLNQQKQGTNYKDTDTDVSISINA